MRLRRIRLRDYRGIDSCDVELLPEGTVTGITVVEGPNEVGKSSLAEALRLLWEYPHSSRHREVRAIQPVGRDVGTRIELQADGADVAFTYVKTFNRDTGAELTITGARSGHLTGKEAHERAAALLNEMVDTDLWRALQVPQGHIAQAELADVPALAAALATDGAGAQTVVDQRDLRTGERISAERARWRTQSGRDRKPLVELRARVDDLRAERDAAQLVLDELSADLGEIDALRHDLPGQRDAVTASSRELLALDHELTRVRELEAHLSELDQTVGTAGALAKHARESVAQRAELRDEVDDAAAAVLDAQARRADTAALQSAMHHLRNRQELRDGVEATTRRRRREAEEARSRCEWLQDADRLRSLRDRRQRVTEVLQRIAEAEAIMAGSHIDDADMKALREAEQHLIQTRAALSAAGSMVRVTALNDTTVQVNGGEAVRLTRDACLTPEVEQAATLRIGDVAQIDVVPGRALESVTSAVAEALERRDELLRHSGFDDLSSAERAFDELVEIRARHAGAVAERDGLLGGSALEELDAEIVSCAARCKGTHCADDREVAAVTESGLDGARRRRNNADERLRRVEAERADAEEQVAVARAAVERLRASDEQARMDLHVAEEAHRRASDRLERLRRHRDDASLDEECRRREQELDDARAARRAAARRLEEVDATSLRERCDSMQAAVNAGTERVREAERRLSALEATVAARSADGPKTRLDAAQSRLDVARAALVRAERRADAAQLTERLFTRHRSEQRRRYLAPLGEQIETLGRILWGPSFAVELDEDLRIRTRILHGRALPFDQLSLGAQEQLTVIGRLACAIVVGVAGAPILIDDALGFSDPDRLRRMGAVFGVAGRSCQIVLLTCHPQRYLHVAGARLVQMGRRTSGATDTAAA